MNANGSSKVNGNGPGSRDETAGDDDDDEGAHMGSTTLYALLTDGKERQVSVFGKNLPKLKNLKKKYDPGLLFDKWYAIEPTPPGEMVQEPSLNKSDL